MATLSQGTCPQCGGRGYTTYDDGGYHCFSCGVHSSGSGFVGLAARINKPKETIQQDACHPLPRDAEPLIGAHGKVSCGMQGKAQLWVQMYGITQAEIDQHHVLWSTQEQLLIFPVYDSGGSLLMWQGRYFGNYHKHPKYLTRGKKETVLHVIQPDKPAPFVVLTEDLISAIKVGRQYPAIPLWGSSLSKEVVQRIATQYERAYLWLDYDKRDYAIKASFEHCMRLHITPIITQLDPKCYSDDEIKTIMQRDYTDD